MSRTASSSTSAPAATLAAGVNSGTPGTIGSRHRQGLNVLWVDGSVRYLDDTYASEELRALATPGGGEPVQLGF